MSNPIQLNLIPGVLCDETLFNKVIPNLNQNIATTRHSIAHFTSISDAVDSLNQNIDEPTFLLGFSLGGWVAETYARKHPNKTLGLILVSTPNSPIESKSEMAMSAVCQQLKNEPRSLENVLNESIKYYFDQSVIGEIIQEYKSMATRVGAKSAIAQYQILINQKKRLAAPTDKNLPILLIHGNSDQRANMAQQEQLMQIYPQATITSIAHSGHFVPLEKPQAMAQAINDFLKTQTSNQA